MKSMRGGARAQAPPLGARQRDDHLGRRRARCSPRSGSSGSPAPRCPARSRAAGGVRLAAQNPRREDDRPRHRSGHRQHGLRRRGAPGRADGGARRRRRPDLAGAPTRPRGSPRSTRGSASCSTSTGPRRSRWRSSTSAPTCARRSRSARRAASCCWRPASAAIPCWSYTPQQIKGAVCGSGRAAKDQVAADGPDAARRSRSCRGPTTPPTRSRSRSATPTPRRCGARSRTRPPSARAPRQGGPPMIALLAGEVAVRRPDHVVALLRRRRLPARGVGRDAAPGPRRGQAGDAPHAPDRA